MQHHHFDTIADAATALSINAFESFRAAAHEAGIPLGIINAFADYKAAVDFVLQAVEAEAAGRPEDASVLLRWSGSVLVEMERELAAVGR